MIHVKRMISHILMTSILLGNIWGNLNSHTVSVWTTASILVLIFLNVVLFAWVGIVIGGGKSFWYVVYPIGVIVIGCIEPTVYIWVRFGWKGVVGFLHRRPVSMAGLGYVVVLVIVFAVSLLLTRRWRGQSEA